MGCVHRTAELEVQNQLQQKNDFVPTKNVSVLAEGRLDIHKGQSFQHRKWLPYIRGNAPYISHITLKLPLTKTCLSSTAQLTIKRQYNTKWAPIQNVLVEACVCVCVRVCVCVCVFAMGE